MKKIKTYSTKHFYTLKFSIWEFNIISATRAFRIPHEECISFDLDRFNYEFEKSHGLLNIAEDIESYSYS